MNRFSFQSIKGGFDKIFLMRNINRELYDMKCNNWFQYLFDDLENYKLPFNQNINAILAEQNERGWNNLENK